MLALFVCACEAALLTTNTAANAANTRMIKTKEFHVSMMKAYEDANYALCKKDSEDWTAGCSSKAATYCGACSVSPDTVTYDNEGYCTSQGTCSIGGHADSEGECTARGECTAGGECNSNSGTWTATWLGAGSSDPCCNKEDELKC